MIESYGVTFLSVLAVELMDKTRLVALLLSTRYRAPFQLFFGMTLGYIIPIALAVWGAGWIVQMIPQWIARWAVAATLILFGVYLVWSREEEDEKNHPWLVRLERFSPFWVGFALVMVTEFMDKSQLATAGLAMRFQRAWPVFLGSLSAQAVLNLIYVWAGRSLGERLPLKWIHWVTGAAFILFGLLALIV